MFINDRCYSVYITTNAAKKVLYCGVTNDLLQRITEHYLLRGDNKSFTGRYNCYWLIYFEDFDYVDDAIEREKEIKGWSRQKKLALIKTINPRLDLLNFEQFETWPPVAAYHRKDL